MIRVGIVGSNYGRLVQLPAFRLDPRCEVTALAGSDAARTADLARASGIAQGFADWRTLVESDTVDAIAIATPPRLQPEIAMHALWLGKPVFAEKPMAGDAEAAAAMLRQAGATPTMVDFNFTEVPAWRKTKELLDGGAIGTRRHVMGTWNVDNYATRMRLKHWKTSAQEGGGALGNLASHSLHTFEWFCGPIAGLSARLSGLPDDPAMETTVALSLAFRSGAAGHFAMSCASYLAPAIASNSTARTVRWCWRTRPPTTCAASPSAMRGDRPRRSRRLRSRTIRSTANFQPRPASRRCRASSPGSSMRSSSAGRPCPVSPRATGSRC